MISYDDPKWKELRGGYKTPYDPTHMLRKLDSNVDDRGAWEELWNELHHQGDLGEASYAAVPHLLNIATQNANIGWDFYSLVSLIEIERHKESNPELPSWLAAAYKEAWTSMPKLITSRIINEENELNIRAMLGALAISKGLVNYGTLLTCFDQSEVTEFLNEYLG